jgi:hypothetical protein
MSSIFQRGGAGTFFIISAVLIGLCCHDACAQIVAQQDFDSNNDALPGSFDPSLDNLDGGVGDFFGVGSACGWPQGTPPGVPFSLADDSVVDWSGCGLNPPFPADDEGVFGQNSDGNNSFFAISDTRKWGPTPAVWMFDISGATDLEVAVDIGADADGDFSYDPGAIITFEATIDAGPVQTLFSFVPSANLNAAGSLRPMDAGTNEDPTDLLYGTGDASITKTFGEGGTSTNPADLYLDKTVVASGALDTYSTSVNGTGGTLTLRMTSNIPFRGVVFDNIVIRGEAGDGTFPPDTFNRFRGVHVSGDLNSLLDSDNVDLCHNPGITLNPMEAPVTIDFIGTSPDDTPSSISVTIESSANTVGLGLTFRFWNFNTNAWETVGTAGQSNNVDTVRTFNGTPANHVDNGTGEVRTRYEVRRVSFIFLFPWTDCVDQVFWTAG